MKGNMILNQPAHPYAFEFDGVDDYVDFGDVCDVGTNDFILFAWVKSTKTTLAGIFGKWKSGSSINWYVRYADAGQQGARIRFEFGNGSTDWVEYKIVSDYTDWKFISIVVKGREYVKIYENGVEKPISILGSFPFETGGSLDNENSLQFGSIGNGFQLAQDNIGISGIYIFDGQNGAPSSLPSNYEEIIRTIYNNTKHLYQ
jgi:hypothetical protein